MRFSELLLNFRAKNDLTQEEAGKVLGVTANMVWLYEREKCSPSKKNRIRFENLFKKFEEEKENV